MVRDLTEPPAPSGRLSRTGTAITRLPPASYFLVSSVFHYLGPSFAVLLFAHVEPLGVAWLRIASAAVFFAAWRRPWRLLHGAGIKRLGLYLAMGLVLALMNAVFYLAVARLPLATVGAIEFLGPVLLAAAGARNRRNLMALILTLGGVAVLTEIRVAGDPQGFVFAFANCVGFGLYIVLGHRIANVEGGIGGQAAPAFGGIDRLGLSMLIAAIVASPLAGFAAPAFTHPIWLLWAIGVGLCSSVIPYVADQLAMRRLPRATFALMLALLPAAATVIGLVVLAQVPTLADLAGIALVIAGVALHRDKPAQS